MIRSKPFAPIALLALASLAACNSTSGGLISQLPFQVSGAARDAGIDSPMFFTSEEGWQIELDQAVIAVGPFYFNTQPPETQTLQSGVVLVQFTQQSLVDALDPTPYDAGFANGETGQAVAVEVDLFPPDATQSQASLNLLNQSSAFIAGTAQRLVDGGSQVVPFQGFITIDQSLVSTNDPAADPLPAWQRVPGAECDLTFTTVPAILQAQVDPTHWFDGVDFSSLIPPPPTCVDLDAGDSGDAGVDGGGCDAGPGWTPDAGPLSWTLDGTFNSLLVNGIRAQTGVYSFNLVPTP